MNYKKISCPKCNVQMPRPYAMKARDTLKCWSCKTRLRVKQTVTYKLIPA